MINLSDILQSAHGGQAVDTLAGRFGLTPEQVQSVIDAATPAIEMGLQNKLQGGGLGSILAQFGHPANQASYGDPSAAGSPQATQQGGSILGELFGGGQTLTQVAEQIAAEAGVPASVVQAMLPALASILAGGLMHGAASGGFGGILSNIVGSMMGGQSGAQSGGLGGLLGGLFGGGGAQDTPPAAVPAASGGEQSTLDEISNMITSGSTSSPDHQAALANILGR